MDQRVTFLAPLAAYRQVAVDRVPLVLVHRVLVRLVVLARRAVVVLERRAEPVHLQRVARSAVAAAVVDQAVAAAEQTRSMR
ncbi:MAG: hypothetical protein QOE81_1023 [Verrucomicrobiota bacterium]